MKYLILLLLTSNAFAVTVTDKLSWGPLPAARQNGDPLKPSDLKGYEIYYTVQGGTEGVITVPGATTLSMPVVHDLAPRAEPYVITYSVAAVDTNGVKGVLSNVAQSSRSVPVPPPTVAEQLRLCKSVNEQLITKGAQCARDLKALQAKP